ncbi:MAG: ABC transporter permease [Desulfobacterium sp.]
MTFPRPGVGATLSSPCHSGRWKGVWLLLPLLLYLGVFYFVPLIQVLLQSLFDPEFTLEHYRVLVTYPVYGKILFNTIKISFLVSLACVVIGYPMAWAIVFSRPGLGLGLLTIVMVPFWVSVLVRTYSWMIILGRYGVINKLLMATGLTTAPLELMYNRTGVYIGMIYIMLPYAILPMQNAMHSIDRDVLKASASLGATFLQTFRQIILPLSLTGVATGFVLVFIISAGIFITPSLMGSPSDTMIAMSINAQLEMVNNWGFAGALSMVLLLTVCLLIFLFFKLFGSAALTGSDKGETRFHSKQKKEFFLFGYDFYEITRQTAWAVETFIFYIYEQASRILPKDVLPKNLGKIGLIGVCALISLFLILPVFIILPIGFSNDFVIGFPPKSLGLGLFHSCL